MDRCRNSSLTIDKTIAGEFINRHDWRITKQTAKLYGITDSFSDNRNQTRCRGLLIYHAKCHLIGNHTYSHIQLTKSNREIFKQELIDTNAVIKEITGKEVEYVRPPYGSWDKSFEKELNMFPVLWTVDPLDWCSGNVACITEKIVEKAEENDIILMHDYFDTSVTAALKAIDELMEEGYTFVTVEEILFD